MAFTRDSVISFTITVDDQSAAPLGTAQKNVMALGEVAEQAAAAAISATGLTVPTALEAMPTATSRGTAFRSSATVN